MPSPPSLTNTLRHAASARMPADQTSNISSCWLRYGPQPSGPPTWSTTMLVPGAARAASSKSPSWRVEIPAVEREPPLAQPAQPAPEICDRAADPAPPASHRSAGSRRRSAAICRMPRNRLAPRLFMRVQRVVQIGPPQIGPADDPGAGARRPIGAGRRQDRRRVHRLRLPGRAQRLRPGQSRCIQPHCMNTVATMLWPLFRSANRSSGM